jgi:hypothetical protein
VPRNLALDSTRFLTLFEMTMALAPQLDRIKWSNHQRAYERMCSGEFGRCCRFCEHAFVVEDLDRRLKNNEIVEEQVTVRILGSIAS